MKETETQKSPRKLSTQMRAVLTIFNADPYLMNIVSRHIDTDLDSIHWDPIFKFPWSSGHRAAVIFAYGMWRDEVRPRTNPFDAALNMNPVLQLASLKALAIRWNLQSGLEIVTENPYNQGGVA